MISLFLLFICVVLFPRARAPWLQITSQIMTIKTTLGKFALACCWLLTWLSCHPLRPLTLSFIHKYLWHLETGPPLCPLSTNATPPPLTLRVWVCPSVWLWSCHDQTPGCTGEPQSTSGFSHRSGSYCFLCWFFLQLSPTHNKSTSLAKTFCAILSLKRIIIVNTIKIRSLKFNPILLFKIQIAQREEKSLYFCNRV